LQYLGAHAGNGMGLILILMVAVVATARKLRTIIRAMLLTGKLFSEAYLSKTIDSVVGCIKSSGSNGSDFKELVSKLQSKIRR
jgi:hypothetical protein